MTPETKLLEQVRNAVNDLPQAGAVEDRLTTIERELKQANRTLEGILRELQSKHR